MNRVDEAATLRAHVAHAKTHLIEAQRALQCIVHLADELAPLEPLKVCSACGTEYTRTSWAKLEYLGNQDDGEEVCELRNCACRTTLAVVLGPSPTR